VCAPRGGRDSGRHCRGPYALVGSIDQIVDEIMQHRKRWGIRSYVVRADTVDLVAPLIERLACSFRTRLA